MRTADEELEQCCQDVCHWCRMHAANPSRNGPAERLPDERAYSHAVINDKGRVVERAWCNATPIRERRERGCSS